MINKFTVPRQYVRLSGSTLFAVPMCYGIAMRDAECKICPVYNQCMINQPLETKLVEVYDNGKS
ncbi:MAG: hypothetical protein WCY09_08795 [Candidatus Omnitrophota bacterium]|jgi:hypothetical protein